ncbi:MAG: GDP-mannose 4,6-dehydratase [Methanobacterium sp.]|jgi:nucleoside-diphosphate-sugar epimerase
MRALVTGCAGFIGSNLVDYLLEKDFEVIGIDNFTDYYSRNLKESNITDAKDQSNFTFLEKDLLEMNKFPEKIDYVFHLAAQAGVRASWGEKFHIYTKNNIEATQRLLEFYKDVEIEKFVYSSSSSVYGDVQLPMNEKSILKPVSPYGVSKLAGEHLSYLYWKNYGVPTVSLRYFTVYGPRQRPDMAINKFTQAIINNNEISIYGNGEQTRDFTYVEDVLKANMKAAENYCTGEIYNIGGGNRISISDLINILEGIINKKATIKKRESEKGDVKDTLADVEKAQKELKWTPKVRIENGLSKYVKWILESSV